MRVRTQTAISAALLALLLGACEMRVVTTISVEEGGSGAVGFVLAMDEEFRELVADAASESGEDADLSDPDFWTDEILDMDTADLPEGTVAVPYEDGDFLGVELTMPFDTPEALGSIDDTAELGGGDPPSLTVDGNTYVLTIPLDTSEFTDVMDDGMPFSAGSIFEISYIATMPGEITETNGVVDPDDPSRVTWDIDLDDVEDLDDELTVTSVSGGIDWWIVAGAALVVGVAGIFLAYRRAARPKEPTGPGQAEEPNEPLVAPESG